MGPEHELAEVSAAAAAVPVAVTGPEVVEGGSEVSANCPYLKNLEMHPLRFLKNNMSQKVCRYYYLYLMKRLYK